MGMICKRPFITQTDAMYQKLDSQITYKDSAIFRSM